MLTTAVALGAVALPFVVMGSRAGLEVVHPMAVVILGGVVTTTFLGLFVLPALYVRFGGGRVSEAQAEEDLLYRWAGVEPGTPAAPAAGSASAGSAGAGTSQDEQTRAADESAEPAGSAERGE
jgi:hypothetical protein